MSKKPNRMVIKRIMQITITDITRKESNVIFYPDIFLKTFLIKNSIANFSN